MATSGCSWHQPTASPSLELSKKALSSPPLNILSVFFSSLLVGIMDTSDVCSVRSDSKNLDQTARREQVVRHLMSVGRISISCGIGAHEHAAQNGTIVPFNRNQVGTPGCADGFSEFEKMDSLFLVFSSQYSY